MDKKSKPQDTPIWSAGLLATRRARARITGLLLGGFVVLFFLVTIIRLGDNVADIFNRPL